MAFIYPSTIARITGPVIPQGASMVWLFGIGKLFQTLANPV